MLFCRLLWVYVEQLTCKESARMVYWYETRRYICCYKLIQKGAVMVIGSINHCLSKIEVMSKRAEIQKRRSREATLTLLRNCHRVWQAPFASARIHSASLAPIALQACSLVPLIRAGCAMAIIELV